MSTRIAGIEVWREDMRLTRTYRIAGEEISSVDNAFCLIRDDQGHFGLGAASPMPEICGESIEDALSALKDYANALIHSTFEAPEGVIDNLSPALVSTPAARAAIDMALYDLHCKKLDVPLVEYLGRKYVELETSVTIGITDDKQVREELAAHLRNGFHTIKIKIGDDVERDISIVHRLREWGGSEFRLRVDANEGYDLHTLQRFLEQTSGMNIQLIEQPLLSPASDSMLNLTTAVRRSSMADEDLITEEDAALLARNQAYGIWNIKLMKSGGISPAKRIAQLAFASGIDLMWGCNDESRVSIAAALHLAMSCQATKYLDLDGSFDIAHDIVEGGFHVKDGKLRCTDAAGLGVRMIG